VSCLSRTPPGRGSRNSQRERLGAMVSTHSGLWSAHQLTNSGWGSVISEEAIGFHGVPKSKIYFVITN
jgi:hypothetical protein